MSAWALGRDDKTAAPCEYCKATTHTVGQHFDVAFTNPVTGDPYPVPDDLRDAAITICRVYNIKGICDPMWIANAIAKRIGRGDGEHHFFDVNARPGL